FRKICQGETAMVVASLTWAATLWRGYFWGYLQKIDFENRLTMLAVANCSASSVAFPAIKNG
ncbi:MAG: hypothetical protein LBD67_04230, partial [Candidatus Accumulibacter sp.]|nr:hypothetical protein [Accumulibacter sp.]